MKIEDKNTQTELVLPPKRKKALALNLAHEVAHIQKHGDAYLPIFLDNMRSFTMETDTHGRIFDFQHIVRRFPDGTVRLYFDHRHGQGDDGSLIEARASYLKPAEEEDRPLWDRQRHMREHQAIVAIEEMLESVEPGSEFVAIESSNAPFDQPEDALEGTFYGNFSFVRTHTLQTSQDGKEVLRGHGLKHYLTWDAQAALHKRLTGNTEVTKESLLGTVDRFDPEAGYGTIEDIIDIDGYIRNLPGDLFVPHEDDEAGLPHEGEIHDFIDATEPVLLHIFRNLSRDSIGERRDTLELVTYWREAVRDFCKGVDRREEILVAYSEEPGLHAMPLMAFRDMYSEHVFEERFNSCGSGMGYGELGGNSISGIPTYANLAYGVSSQERKAASGPDRRVVTCPTCKKDVTFSRSQVMKSKKLECPCGACATGCNAEVIALNSRVPKRVPGFDDQDLPMAA